MDLKDTWSRIVTRHLTVIVTTLLLGLGSVALLVAGAHTSYVATARIQAAAKQPTSDVEAAALESQVQGIAGSPAVTEPALGDTHITADATKIATKHVKVTRLGSSSLVDIAVTMTSPRTAVPLANAIAARTVSFLNNAGQQQAQAAINDIDASTSTLTKTRDSLLTQLSQTSDPSKTSAIVTQLSGIEQQLAGLMTTRGQLVTQVHTATAQLVDEALVAHRTSRHLVTFLALGIIGSLAIGLLIAAVRETVQPTVPSGRVVAEMLGAPLLTGVLDRDGSGNAAALRAGLVQSAQRRGIRTIQVLGPAPAGELSAVAAAVTAAIRGPLALLNVAVLGGGKPSGGADAQGALLVVPRGVRVADLRPHEDVLAALEWPVLGVVELPRSRRDRTDADRQTVVDVTTPAPASSSRTPESDDADSSSATGSSAVTLRPTPGWPPSFLPSPLGNPAPDSFDDVEEIPRRAPSASATDASGTNGSASSGSASNGSAPVPAGAKPTTTTAGD
jgi:capsular polysaccharide biosynthesis protein